MFCAPWLVNRIGAKNGLIFAGMVMAMRMVASGLVAVSYTHLVALAVERA